MKIIKYLFFVFFLIIAGNCYACSCVILPDIESKADLEKYSFIALIEVDSLYRSSIKKQSRSDIFYEISFSTIELYKGDKRSSMIISGGNRNLDVGWTSCDMGVDKSEQWVIYAYEDDQDHARTGYCTYSHRYKNKDGQRNWSSDNPLGTIKILRKLFGIEKESDRPVNGTYKTFYPNGNKELVESYKDGKLHGTRDIFYASGSLLSRRSYKNGEKDGTFTWYNADGSLKRKYQYIEGNQVGTNIIYDYDGSVRFRRTYNMEGDLLHGQHFGNENSLNKSVTYNPVTKNRIATNYYPNGLVHYIYINDEDYNSLKSIEYFETGEIEKDFTYFPANPAKDREVKVWNQNGDLIKHYVYWENRIEKIVDKKVNNK